jgi:hypothetical protein
MSNASESLHIANGNLHAGLARLLPEPHASVLLNSEDLSSLLTELLRAGDCLRSIAPDSARDAELEKEISEYRRNLEQLAQILPCVHGRLLTEKARLEIAQAHVTAAAAWAQASTKIL